MSSSTTRLGRALGQLKLAETIHTWLERGPDGEFYQVDHPPKRERLALPGGEPEELYRWKDGTYMPKDMYGKMLARDTAKKIGIGAAAIGVPTLAYLGYRRYRDKGKGK